MSRRYYEYLYTEISVAAKHRISGYSLWLLIWEAGGDPDDLSRDQVRVFVEQHLQRQKNDSQPSSAASRLVAGGPIHMTCRRAISF